MGNPPKPSFVSIGSLSSQGQVALEVMNPRGEIPPPPSMGIRQRLNDLPGKKIALLDNGKAGAGFFLDALEALFKKQHPTTTILRLVKPEAGRIIYDAKDWYPEVARQADAFIFATGD
jgi:hypothetical protein